MKLILWHGSDRPIDRFSGAGPDRALHLGTRAQAEMRNRAFLHEVEVEVSRVRRSRDPGGDWSGRVRAARAAGAEAIVYLNRYEGVSAETIERLSAAGRLSGLDRLPDRAFRLLVPEAEDSWIILDPSLVRTLRILRGGPSPSPITPGAPPAMRPAPVCESQTIIQGPDPGAGIRPDTAPLCKKDPPPPDHGLDF
ncbi:MAG: hypothetical protein KC466_09630 [Myxococcales bacterium]|nr:hypothetical protein [Myxococcales bacterium]